VVNDPREEKLPKWAQTELSVLRQEVARLENLVNASQQEFPSSAISYSTDYEHWVRLPEWTTVRFENGKGAEVFVTAHPRFERRIEARSNNQLAVKPMSGNAVELCDEE